MTLQQLAAFSSAFDNCKANHPNHGWYHSIAEGLKAVAGERNLRLSDEELAAVEEMQKASGLGIDVSANYDRDAAIAAAYAKAGLSQDHVTMLLNKYGRD